MMMITSAACCRPDDQLCTMTLVPVTSLPSVFELSYYASAILPIFASESVIGKKTIPLKLFVCSFKRLPILNTECWAQS